MNHFSQSWRQFKRSRAAVYMLPSCMVMSTPSDCRRPCTPAIAMAGLSAGFVVALLVGADLSVLLALIVSLGGVGVTTAVKQAPADSKGAN